MAKGTKFQARGTIDNIDGRVVNDGETVTLSAEEQKKFHQLIDVGSLSPANGSEKDDDGDNAGDDLSEMTKAQLVAHADAKGITIDPSAKKEDLLKQIQDATPPGQG